MYPLQIIVQNEHEKKLVETFFTELLIHPNSENTFNPDGKETSPLNSDETRLLRHSFEDVTIAVEPEVTEMSFSKDDIISHVFECDELKKEFENVTYSLYLEKQEQQKIKPWEHTACWNEDVLE